MRLDHKGLLLWLLYGRWGRTAPIEPGYSILLPFPGDMPFLLSFSLEGLRHLDLTHCRQILVVGDGTGDEGESVVRDLVKAQNDPRIEVVEPRAVDRLVVSKLRGVGSSLHWLAIIRGTARAKGEAIFLHDADAFFLEPGAIERQYREFQDRGMETLGVSARWDLMFQEIGYEDVPGTWEMMYSTRWARRHSPGSHKGRLQKTPHGSYVFDTMLYPQYLDYALGKVGVMANPPRIVHFNGTIVTYRAYRERLGQPVVDELFRLLLLAMLEELIPSASGNRVVPSVDELARGLTDPSSRVTYGSAVAVQEFPIFRKMIDELCEAPIMIGERAARLAELIRPFDDYFAIHKADETLGSLVRPRSAGLG